MTKQEIFDRVSRHLLTQQCKSRTPEWDFKLGRYRCLYRGPNGTSCAVGCLIPDDQYDPTIEHQGVASTEVQARLPFKADPDTNYLLLSLQQVHDYQPFWAWPDALRAVASWYGLTTDFRGLV